MCKKLFLVICLSVLALFGSLSINTEKVSAYAASEIAMELSTQTVLTQSNADTKMPMASTTKIMTALVIIEDCNLDEVITVPDEAVGVEGSSIYLKKGEEIDVRDLVYGLMLRSGNDAATALAIHHSGSVEKFVEAMNKKAASIGAENTNFTNPSGLPDENHYTTARDLCNVACCAMKNETFKSVVSTKSYSGKFRSYANKNKMLYNYEGANGVKTGYTVKAGRCLVSSAERDGMDVVTVVLNCYDMYERSSALLDECFSDYKLLEIDENKVFMSDRVLCKLDKTQKIVVPNSLNITFKVIPLKTPEITENGKVIALLNIYCENSLIFEHNLYSIIDNE